MPNHQRDESNWRWQIDCQQLDIFVKPETDTEPVQVWCTMVIDRFSRVTVGCYLSLEPPNQADID